jgi:hypothetical protein
MRHHVDNDRQRLGYDVELVRNSVKKRVVQPDYVLARLDLRAAGVVGCVVWLEMAVYESVGVTAVGLVRMQGREARAAEQHRTDSHQRGKAGDCPAHLAIMAATADSVNASPRRRRGRT